jgi:DNA repair exonuclease SbcCD ATPase subunit
METRTLWRLLGASAILMLMLLMPSGVLGQTKTQPDPHGSDSAQVLQEILKEIRLLRADLVHMSIDAKRSQVLQGRLSVEQEQVNRLTRELADIDGRLGDVRSQQRRETAALDEAKSLQDAGLKGEGNVAEITSRLDDLARHEQALLDMQGRFTTDLQAAQAYVTQLNALLDEVDRDMAQTAPRGNAEK